MKNQHHHYHQRQEILLHYYPHFPHPRPHRQQQSSKQIRLMNFRHYFLVMEKLMVYFPQHPILRKLRRLHYLRHHLSLPLQEC